MPISNPKSRIHHSGTSKPPPATIADVLRLLFPKGTVCELRALGIQRRSERPHVEAGFFDDFDKLQEYALALEKVAKGVYITLNPLKPEILFRRRNRTDYANDRDLAGDTNVLTRLYLLIDA